MVFVGKISTLRVSIPPSSLDERMWMSSKKPYRHLGVEPKIGVVYKPPKSSILIGFGTIINHPFWGFSPYFWKHPLHVGKVLLRFLEPDVGMLTTNFVNQHESRLFRQSLSPTCFLMKHWGFLCTMAKQCGLWGK